MEARGISRTNAFIKCPFEAIAAMQNFGFKLVTDFGHYRCDYGDTCSLDDDDCLIDIESAIDYIKKVSPKKIYIADESLPLLEPMVGDYVIVLDESWGVESGQVCRITYNEQTGNLWIDCFTRDFQVFGPDGIYYKKIDETITIKAIILRNGKPFPTIQYEAVE